MRPLIQRESAPGTEGDSASGSITKSRDVNTQAVFSLRGKPLNCFGLSKRVVYENEEFNLLQAALGNLSLAQEALPAGTPEAEAVEQAALAARRASDLTRQLLGVSRHEPMVRGPVDVRTAMAHVRHLHRTQRERFRSLEFTADQWCLLADDARRAGVDFLATPFDAASADAVAFLEDVLVPPPGERPRHLLVDEALEVGADGGIGEHLRREVGADRARQTVSAEREVTAVQGERRAGHLDRRVRADDRVGLGDGRVEPLEAGHLPRFVRPAGACALCRDGDRDRDRDLRDAAIILAFGTITLAMAIKLFANAE